MKKLSYLIVLALILGLVLTGCLLSNVGQVPTSEQSGITYLTKALPLASLVGLWHFDDDDALDYSGNLNHGTLMGDTSWISGKFGNALSFDGDGDYVQLPTSNTILNTNTFTIEAWFKTSLNHPAYGGTEGRLVNLHWKDTASTAVSLYVEKDKIGLLYHKGSMQHVWVKHEVNYFNNVWHHIAVTYDTTTYRLYYDGSEVASKDDNFGGFGAYPAFLGAYISTERFFNGDIDEVRIWNVALSQDQLGKVYEFDGFFRPIDNDVLNVVKAGRAIPVKFSLDGDKGLDIFVVGYPKSKVVSCGLTSLIIEDEETMTAGDSSLNYDADADQYIYVWKTDKAWAGTCRQLEVKLNDGQSYYANFEFK